MIERIVQYNFVGLRPAMRREWPGFDTEDESREVPAAAGEAQKGQRVGQALVRQGHQSPVGAETSCECSEVAALRRWPDQSPAFDVGEIRAQRAAAHMTARGDDKSGDFNCLDRVTSRRTVARFDRTPRRRRKVSVQSAWMNVVRAFDETKLLEPADLTGIDCTETPSCNPIERKRCLGVDLPVAIPSEIKDHAASGKAAM